MRNQTAVHGSSYLVSGLLALLLTACAGGGGSSSPAVTSAPNVPNTGTVVADPNAVITTASNQTYNLTHGAEDVNGPAMAASLGNTVNALPTGLQIFNTTVNNATNSGPALVDQLNPEVTAAWAQGWTGKGVNVLVSDNLINIGLCSGNSSYCHPVKTAMNLALTAPGATIYGSDYGFNTAAVDMRGNTLSGTTPINVINLSWFYQASWNCGNGNCTAPTAAQYNSELASLTGVHQGFVNILNGTTAIPNISNLNNAVVVIAAGNDGLDAKYNLTVNALANADSVKSRTLVVGATTSNGTTASPTTIASYSNRAGSVSAISDRFVLANGNLPYSNTVTLNGALSNGGMGTSYAAPVIAGYSAIVMQKFPNLSAPQVASVILDTARYDTLSCNTAPGGCDPSIYGRGVASISRALAPVGFLK